MAWACFRNYVLVLVSGNEVLSKWKCRGFRATSLSIYDFSTLYTTLPHDPIKGKLLDLIEWAFKRALKAVHFIWHVMKEKLFFTSSGQFGHVRMYAMPYPISWISYTHKLLEFRCVQIADFS